MVLETVLSSLVGLLGAGLTTYSNYKLRKLEVDNQIKLMEAETKNMLIEAKANIMVADATAKLKIEDEEMQIFRDSMSAQKDALPAEWLSLMLKQKGAWRFLTIPIGMILILFLGIGDVINHLMRSALTLYSLGIASWVTYQCWGVIPDHSDSQMAWELWQESATTVMLLAVTMVTWWFGDRRIAKHLMQTREAKKV